MPRKKQCPVCRNTGTVWGNYFDHAGFTPDEVYPCPKCYPDEYDGMNLEGNDDESAEDDTDVSTGE